MSQGIDRSAYMGAFREEMDEHLGGLSAGLLALESRPEDASPAAEVFRRAHTIKGSARMMGFDDVADVAHAMEDLLDDLRAGRLRASPSLLDALLTGVDLLRDLMASSTSGDGNKPDVQAAIRWLAGLRVSEGLAARVAGDQAAESEPEDAPEADYAQRSSFAEISVVASPPVASSLQAVEARRVEKPPRETVRIEVQRIDTLLNLAGELTVLDSARRQWSDEVGRLLTTVESVTGDLQRGDLVGVVQQLRRLSQAASNGSKRGRRLLSQETEVIRELHYQVSALRMMPISAIFSMVPRAARDLARDKRKEIEVAIEGEDTEIDREVLEQVKDAVLHLVRNAVDHGIESPGLRQAADKPRIGRLRVGAYSRGEQAIIEVEDDGAGVDARAVQAAAVRRGLIAAGEAGNLDEAECIRLLFLPGFTTSSTVSDTSGRGVGLDVVKAQVDALKGNVRLDTWPGRGTRVTLELPITLAYTHVLLFRVDQAVYGVSCSATRGIIDLAPEGVRTLQGSEAVEVGGGTVPLVWMHRILGIEPVAEGRRRCPALLLGPPERPIAFAVDEVVGDDNVIVKPLGRLLRRVPNVSGGIVLGDGRVALLLSASSLIDAARGAPGAGPARKVPVAVLRKGKRVLVADDSATTRELQRGILDAAGYEVVTAVDGQDALEKLRSQRFALVVSDVQMPRMDGFQLAAAIRADQRLSQLPIVIVSGLESDEHRRRGLELGVQAYVGKGSYDQTTVLDTIERLIG